MSGLVKSKLTGFGLSPALVLGVETTDANEFMSSVVATASELLLRLGVVKSSWIGRSVSDSSAKCGPIAFLWLSPIVVTSPPAAPLCGSAFRRFSAVVPLASTASWAADVLSLFPLKRRFLIRGSNFLLRKSGLRQLGRASGRAMSLRRKTTKCIAVKNSSKLRHPSFDTSESCHITRNSEMGSRDFSKNSFARVPGITPPGFGCMLKNCVV